MLPFSFYHFCLCITTIHNFHRFMYSDYVHLIAWRDKVLFCLLYLMNMTTVPSIFQNFCTKPILISLSVSKSILEMIYKCISINWIYVRHILCIYHIIHNYISLHVCPPIRNMSSITIVGIKWNNGRTYILYH